MAFHVPIQDVYGNEDTLQTGAFWYEPFRTLESGAVSRSGVGTG